jgi:hypothetical protein
MGQIVFQGAAGGQVALVGPNPSTSFSLNLPAGNGTLLFQDLSFTTRLTNLNVNATTNLAGFVSSQDAQFTSFGAIGIPAGTLAQRPQTPYYGQLRYNTELLDYEGFTPLGWASLGGGATQGVTSVNGKIGAVFLTYTDVNAAPETSNVSAGTGLTGGGNVGANPSISITPTGITPKAYGDSYQTNLITVNAQGQITEVSETTIAITGSAQLLDYGKNNGVATLNSSGTVPFSELPSSIITGLNYQGQWNAATNTPTITSGVGKNGDFYIVSVAGNTNIDGTNSWAVGNWIIFEGTKWDKVEFETLVLSVNGQTGNVNLQASDVGAVPTTRIVTAGTGLTGGGVLSSNITLSIPTSGVTPASYNLASVTVNAQGIVTSASNGTQAQVNAAIGYVPAQTGGQNATGTWPISINGNAATASNGGVVSVNGQQGAVTVQGLPSGAIILWSGNTGNIPSGYVLCDGNNGTPNLTDRFIVGAGATYTAGQTGGSTDAIVVSHTHTATVTDPGHVHSGIFADTTGPGGSPLLGPEKASGLTYINTANTGITVANSTTGTSGTNANLPPYYALCYIQKL